MDGRPRRSSSGSSAGRRARSCASPSRCPLGRPAVTEQAPFDERGEPFPTTYYLTCPHLVAAIARIEAAGGVERWTRAARRGPELAASLERATTSSGARPARARGGGRDGAGPRARDRRLEPRPAASSACTPTPRSRSRDRATSSASGSSPSSARSGRSDGCCTARMMAAVASPEVEIARQQWQAGRPPARGAARRPARYARLLEQVDALTAELRRRVGQTFTLAELADAYARRRGVGARRGRGARPRARAGRATLALVTDAAFHLYSRGASDYTP